eukprot:m.47985 g.47985  ORF g.47985 m.47985 type:complete len:136 (-) comp13258_c0_seq2:197-604(-)
MDVIDLCSSPEPSTVSLAQAQPSTIPRVAATTAKRVAPTTKSTKPKKAKKKKSDLPHCVIWVCTHGKGQSSTWRKKDLNLMGVYPTKAAAEVGRMQLIAQHEEGGHGDILVGPTWNDEINLVIREAPMFGFDDAQ